MKLRLRKIQNFNRDKISFVAIVFCAVVGSCTKFFKVPPQEPKDFVVPIPLSEDYPIITHTLVNLIKLKIVGAKIEVTDALGASFSFAPLDDWLTQANPPGGLLKLDIVVPTLDGRNPVLKFLHDNESKIPFKVSLPDAPAEGSTVKGEALFCRIRSDSPDLYERGLCTAFVQSLCNKESRPLPKVRYPVPRCSLAAILETPNDSSSSVGLEPEKLKTIPVSAFPLPLKVKTDYPFSRLGEIKDSLLISLFRRNLNE